MVTTIISDEVAMRNIRNLKIERKKLGLSQSLLANMIGGVSYTTICAIECGRQICSVIVYNALANIFGWETFVPCRKFNNSSIKSSQSRTQSNESETIPIDFENEKKQRVIINQEGAFVKLELQLSIQEKAQLLAISATSHKPMSHIVRKVIQDFLKNYSEASL
ncbi:MAG: helix-turn-helix transcriptional regulator [Synergistaceae bacterium]|nr:helix-turn-helix transcriptional regulator [Synergistaceae bacterium]